MYDLIVIGQGLTGMLSAIWAKEEGQSVALIHKGAGRIIQSTGLMDIIPGSDGDIADLIREYKLNKWDSTFIDEGINRFKTLMNKTGYPYVGDVNSKIEVVTGSGHTKYTALFPETIKPIPDYGTVVIVSIQEILDFQAVFAKENLISSKPNLNIETISIKLGEYSRRPMTQVDVARLLEKDHIRTNVINQIKEQISEKDVEKVDLYVVPSVLGVDDWRKVQADFEIKLGATITVAVGIPPNATSIRLYERLKKELIRSGVRLYSQCNAIGCEVEDNNIKSIKIKNINRTFDLRAKKYILATGGILGGGLEVTADGLRETALNLPIDEKGRITQKIDNLFTVGASNGFGVVREGITGGIYSILSSYEAIDVLKNKQIGGDS